MAKEPTVVIETGDFFLWKGKLVKIVCIESCKCPHCGGDLGKEQFSVIPTSPLFQQNAEPLPTLNN